MMKTIMQSFNMQFYIICEVIEMFVLLFRQMCRALHGVS